MDRVAASPTKRFFVSMLTRDIELVDAILDLLDNCIDGVVRIRQESEPINPNRPYEGFWAKITAYNGRFSIKDNCGGIPKDIAREAAFRLGRVDDGRDSDLPTVGMYGIGMKRAIFKMGKNAVVRSQHKKEGYEVKITEKWLKDDSNWDLEMQPTLPLFEQDGTEIFIDSLNPLIAREFDSNMSGFLGELHKEIARLFGLIIKKGFLVELNGKPISPELVDVVFTAGFSPDTIQPYAFKTTVEDVEIDLIVGFYRGLASTEEVDAETDVPREEIRSGWTVICNDRVILHRDRTKITGWGLSDVPNYHPQFRSIAGVVRFSSNNAEQLPLKTTKRGIEMTSPIYLLTLKYMQEGTKKFTDFTNKWKGRERETTEQFQKAISQDAAEVVKGIPEDKWRSVRGADANTKRFIPDLPLPPRTDDRLRISFFRLEDEVKIVGQYLFDDPNASPSEIGNDCFEKVLRSAREV